MIDREKVAEAIGDCLHACGKFADPYAKSDWTKGPSLLAADAAIAAVLEQLREPSEAMIKAGAIWCGSADYDESNGEGIIYRRDQHDGKGLEDVWQAMLAAAHPPQS